MHYWPLTKTYYIGTIDDLMKFYYDEEEILSFLQEVKDKGMAKEFMSSLPDIQDGDDLAKFLRSNEEVLLAELEILPDSNMFYDLLKAQENMSNNESSMEEYGDWRIAYNKEENCVDIFYKDKLILKVNYHNSSYQEIDGSLVPLEKVKAILGIQNFWRV